MKNRASLFLSKYSVFVAWVMALLFNNWILGAFLNYSLFSKGGSVSEFSATTQDHHWIFRSLDIVAGLLLVATALILYRLLSAKPGKKLIVISTTVMGLANIVDALLPLPCSGTVDKICSAPVRINVHRVSLPNHVLSSTIIGICYVLIPLAGWLYAKHLASSRLSAFSLVTLAATLLFFVLLAAESLSESSILGPLAGYCEELQMLVLGAWFVYLVNHSASSKPAN